MLHAGPSLREQLDLWRLWGAGEPAELSYVAEPTAVRRALRTATAAVIDATASPQQAMDALVAAVAQLGGYSVAVYTETMHEWLEVFVRVHGSPLLLGPLDRLRWQELLESMLRAARRRMPSGAWAQRLVRRPLQVRAGQLRESVTRWSSAAVRRPKAGLS